MQITTLIPAYKPQYLIDLLTCLRYQTVKPSRVIFSDDSPDRSFMAMLTTEPLKTVVSDLNIDVVQGPRAGGYNNFRHLLKIYRTQVERKTDLFHLLLDDDIIFPSFYEEHIKVHQTGNLPCVLSRRWAALESGLPIQDDLPVPPIIRDNAYRVLGLTAEVLFAQTVGASRNWLGEFSNATFREVMAAPLEDTQMAGISYAGLEDLGGFLKASLQGPIGYIQDHLGSFRQNSAQNSANPMGRPLKLAFLAYISLAIAGRNLNVLNPDQSKLAIQQACVFILQHYQQEKDMQEICAVLSKLLADEPNAELAFLNLWQIFSIPPAQPLPA